MRPAAALLCLLALPAQAGVDLSRWKLTLPVDADANGRADEIADPAGASVPPWFEQAGQDLVFRAPAGGARTTGNTAYARSELREMDTSGRPAAWDCLQAARRMRIEQRLLATTPAKPEVVIGQIHDARDDKLMLRYVGPPGANGHSDTGRIEMLWNNAAQAGTLDPAYVLGQPMAVDIEIRQGRLAVRYRNLASGLDHALEARLDPTHIEGACFFKAGLYIQACSTTDLAGQPNQACLRKGWAPARHDAPEARAEVRIQALELDPPPR